MSKRRNDKPYCVVTAPYYFSRASHPISMIDPKNPSYNPATSLIQHLSTCTAEGCNKVETSEKRFPRCSECFTKYCSKECQTKDHKEGEHKKKCSYFKIVKERIKSIFCDQCWKGKWEEVSNPNSKVNFFVCKKCMMIPLNLSSEIMDDPDIYKLWIF